MPCQTRPDQRAGAATRQHRKKTTTTTTTTTTKVKNGKWENGKKEKKKKKKRKKKEKTGNWEIAPRRRCTDANLLPSRDISSFSIPSCPPPPGPGPRVRPNAEKTPRQNTETVFSARHERSSLLAPPPARLRRRGPCLFLHFSRPSLPLRAGRLASKNHSAVSPAASMCASRMARLPIAPPGSSLSHPVVCQCARTQSQIHTDTRRCTQIHTHLKPSYGSLHRLLVRTRPGCLFLPPPCPSLSTGWSQTPSNRPNTSAERGGKAPRRNNAARH